MKGVEINPLETVVPTSSLPPQWAAVSRAGVTRNQLGSLNPPLSVPGEDMGSVGISSRFTLKHWRLNDDRISLNGAAV